MAVLCISNGNNSNDGVRILESEVWKIDKYTMAFEDSNEVRSANPLALSNFCTRYPNSRKGSIRLFLSSGKEWLVFYKKHQLVFPKILANRDFIEYYIETGSRYLSLSEIEVMEGHTKGFFDYLTDFCARLKERDRLLSKCENGGPLYYSFMREILSRYSQYSKQNSSVKSIDQLYVEYYRELKSYPQISKEVVEPSNSSFFYHNDEDYEPDHEVFHQMDCVEPRYDKLNGFLGNPHFDRYYEDIFRDSYLFILGTKIKESEQQEIYQKWYEYGERGFDGTVVCPPLFKNSSYISHFDKANIVFFCIFESDTEVEKRIALALTNQAEVVIQLYDASLYPKYMKKYSQALILLSGMEDEDTLLDKTDDFMIACYNQMREKRYKK